MGLQIPNFDGMDMGVDDDDDDTNLEAELQRLQGIEGNQKSKSDRRKKGLLFAK